MSLTNTRWHHGIPVLEFKSQVDLSSETGFFVPKTTMEVKLDYCITKTKPADIPAVLDMVKAGSEALLEVTHDQVLSWIEQGNSMVAKLNTGRVIGHQGIHIWPQTGIAEMRSAFVLPQFRGQGINTEMKVAMIAEKRAQDPSLGFIAFTEAASKSRRILQRLGFSEISFDETPKEPFGECPAICVLKTGIDCGCKVYRMGDITKQSR